jgi:hypothetical protein
MQFEMNSSLLMLLDPESIRAPTLKDNASRHVQDLRRHIGDPHSSTNKEMLLLRLDQSTELTHALLERVKQAEPAESPRLNKSSSLVLRRRVEKARRSYGNKDDVSENGSDCVSGVSYHNSDAESQRARRERRMSVRRSNGSSCCEDTISNVSDSTKRDSSPRYQGIRIGPQILRRSDSMRSRSSRDDTFSGSGPLPEPSGRKDSTGNSSDPMMRSVPPSSSQRHDRFDRRKDKRIEDVGHGVTRGLTDSTRGSLGPSSVCRPQTPRCHSPGTSPRHQSPDDEK